MSIYDTLNKEQREAVYHTEGPLLILAGAGSGKTRVLTHRIAYLIDEKGVNPWNILAITFTNKAAGEMRERVDQIVGFGSESIWVSTFHSTCVRILRRHIDLLGYDTSFTIYDADDQKTLMKDVCKYLQIDTKVYKERNLLAAISSAKDELITPEEYELNAAGDFGKQKIAKVYKEYEKQLRANNALDFDDLLVKTVQLFQTQPEVLDYYQERFRYIMVDEYQDTNTVQFELIRILAKKYRNLCVVGDDDQSIYKFRGANIKNILNFEHVFEDAKVIKLEQNYRSTGNILNAANAVIKNNFGRKEKSLWTENGEGDKIAFRQFDSGYDEAEYIVGDIKEHVNNGTRTYNDHAVLYRTNAQSRMFEEKFVTASIPYKIVGGINFYARKEIKDLLAYLKTIDNGKDDLAVRRIINVPKRGIGLTTINRVQENALERGVSFYETLRAADLIPNIGRSASKLEAFVALIEECRQLVDEISIDQLLEKVLEDSGYLDMLREDKEIERLENIKELISDIADYVENNPQGSLQEYLQEISLYTDKEADSSGDFVQLMTIHAAKGLEFDNVFVYSLCEGIFPNDKSVIEGGQAALEEERRLAYVAFTRARKQLFLSDSYGYSYVLDKLKTTSRFVKELPEEYLEEVGAKPRNHFASDVDTFTGNAFLSSQAPQFHEEHQDDMIQTFPNDEETSMGGAKASQNDRKSEMKHKKKGRIRKGDLVNHSVFGDGVVIKLEGELAAIAFDKRFGIRKINVNHPSLSKK